MMLQNANHEKIFIAFIGGEFILSEAFAIRPGLILDLSGRSVWIPYPSLTLAACSIQTQ